MTVLWRWPELCRALGVPVVDGPDVGGIAIDSRRVRPGDLFFALRGDPGPHFKPSRRSDRDGHDFIDAALAAGAAGVVAADGGRREGPQLQVADTLDALWALGAAARARLDCPVVAVTGSSGKTTVKGFLAAALDAFAAPGSLNNHLGVPLSLASTPRDSSAAVYEIGTNHEGEIAPLSRLARPDVAVVLNVHPAHRENFPSMAALHREKLSIHEGLDDHGVLVLEESLDASALPDTRRIVRFGRGESARVRLLAVRGGDADYEVAGVRLQARVPGGGEHRAMSLAAVLGVLEVLGRDPAAATALPDTLIVPGRGQVLRGRITLIDDSYNANPESMKAALIALGERPERRRFALLGEMLELGDERAEYHRALAEFSDGLEGVFCVGEGARALFDALPPERRRLWQPAVDDTLTRALEEALEDGDVLLVKGSNRVFWTQNYVKTLSETLL